MKPKGPMEVKGKKREENLPSFKIFVALSQSLRNPVPFKIVNKGRASSGL